ncbi:MAG: FAD-dependent oxidoreductase [Microthrixaceae bacterium]|nr:FAD-dependent oxidoreductase [Microthrixaceae bacterium]
MSESPKSPDAATAGSRGAEKSPVDPGEVVVIGAGPAGLTAAYQLARVGRTSTILEATDVVGGISQTAEREGWKFDIGGHRFFTKVKPVEELWHQILDDDEFLTRPRMSRIYYQGKYYDYPIRPMNALKNLGFIEAVRCVLSYLWAKVRPPKDQSTLEGYVVADYGRRLYEHFFKTYNEKVWGISPSELSADFGAQRIKGMSLFHAVWEPVRARLFGSRGSGKQVTSLIEEFQYPKYGPGMMWQRCTELVEAEGSEVHFHQKVTAVRRGDAGATTVVAEDSDGVVTEYPADEVISSMPFATLVKVLDPPAPPEVTRAAEGLRFRDFLTVALVVPEKDGFPDNWIYIHSPDVQVGRIQNFGQWSPYMVKDGRACLGLEYFVFEGDGMWTKDDADLIEQAKQELGVLGLTDPATVEAGYVVRMPKAYPVYDEGYQAKVRVLRDWLTEAVPNVHPVGRNGMHKYNNQDHSMLTAMLTVQNITEGTSHDIWSVNVEADYHETDSSPEAWVGTAEGSGGSGRDAPVVPAR